MSKRAWAFLVVAILIVLIAVAFPSVRQLVTGVEQQNPADKAGREKPACVGLACYGNQDCGSKCVCDQGKCVLK